MKSLKNPFVLLFGVLLYTIPYITLAQNIVYESLLTESTYQSHTYSTSLAVGATGGSADISNGSSSYIIPIQLPAGTNGVAPSLSLAYSSQGGNGHFGMGWGITGISTIQRGFHTIYHDGETKPVMLDGDDILLLDGNRLIKKTSNTYVKEMHDYSTIEAMGSFGSSPLWFQVETKFGVVMEYGRANNSTLLSDDGTEILFWKLNKTTYKDGNYIEYVYDSSGRDHRISEIRYTGNVAAGLTPYNTIKFHYKDRGETTVKTYEAGSSLNMSHLVDEIEITTEGNTQVKKYELTYATDNINAYLKKVAEVGSDGSSLNPTVFKYGDYENEFEYDNIGFYPAATKQIFTGDYDGDGSSELLIANIVEEDGQQYHNSYSLNGFTQLLPNLGKIGDEKGSYNFYSADFTGEGRDDIFYIYSTEFGNNFARVIDDVVFHSMDNDGNGVSITSMPLPSNPAGFFWHEDKPFSIGDFNGDGVSDVILINGEFILGIGGSLSVDNYEVYIYYGNISTAFEPLTLTGPSTLDFDDWGTRNVNTIDIDGDGRNELMITKGNQSEVYKIDGANVSSQTGSALSFPRENHLMFFGDFNGDRKTDVLTRTDLNNEFAPWYVGRSDGDSFIQDTEFTWFGVPPNIDEFYNGELLAVGDYNGDGRSDIATAQTQGFVNDQVLQMYFSTGDDWYRTSTTLGHDGMDNTFTIQDYNGDGKTDILIRNPAGNGPTNLFEFRSEGQEQLLEKVKNGHDHDVTFGYHNMADFGGWYIRTEQTDHPVNKVRLPMWLPTSIKKEGFNQTSYNYTDAILHKEGKGFLGFEKIESRKRTGVTNATGTLFVEDTHYQLNTDHYFMQPSSIVNKRVGEVLNTKTIMHEVKTFSGLDPNEKYYTTHVKETMDDNVFEGTMTTTGTVYDDYGNAVLSGMDINGVESRLTINVFEQHGSPIPSSLTSSTQSVSRSGSPNFETVETMTYNNLGQLKTKTLNPSSPLSLTYAYDYNNLGNVETTTLSAQGHPNRTSTSIYDSKGRYIESATNTMGQASSSTYDPKWSKPLTTTGLDGLTNTFVYDAFGRLTKTTVPQGYDIDESYTWDSGSFIFKHTMTHPGAPDVTTFYDNLDRVRRVEEEGFNLTKNSTTSYDHRGLVSQTTTPSGFTTSYVYDDFDRVMSSTNDFGTSSFTYSYSGGLLSTTATNAANQVSSTKKDATRKIVESTDYGGTQTYVHHANGEMLSASDGTQTLMSCEYDLFGRKSSMTELNIGTFTYEYDAYGQLTKETSSKGDVTNLIYNSLNQLTTRTGAEGNTSYTYYPSGTQINQLHTITSFEGDVETFAYDQYGRFEKKTHQVDGDLYLYKGDLDIYGNVEKKTFPSGYQLDYTYNANSYLTHIKDATGTQIVFENTTMTALDQLDTYKSNINGVNFSFDLDYFHQYETDNSNTKTDFQYTWDYTSGNLTSRIQNVGSGAGIENFTYDNLNRLTSQQFGIQPPIVTNYTNNGNIDNRDGVGTQYLYDDNKINAVTGIEGADYTNLSMYNQHIKYNSLLQPEQVTEHGNTLDIIYGSDYQRLKSTYTSSTNDVKTRYYFGEYELVKENGTDTHIHYVNVGRGIHMVIEQTGGTTNYYRTVTDYQGSVMYLGDTSGDEYYFKYDAWGNYRANTGSRPSWFNRGYTGHEHLDEFQLVNMNGRLYDPVVGRMLSPDNELQLPYFSQNYNKYSYVLNNPLKYTDPDGEFIVPILIGAAIGVVSNGINNVIHHRSFFDGAGKAAIFGAIGGAVSHGIGEFANYALKKGFEKVGVSIFQGLAHSWTGAVFSLAQGSNPLAGYLSGGISSGVSSGIGTLGKGAELLYISGGLSGGIGSVIGGGNFWDGISQGLIVAGLNHAVHELLPTQKSTDPPEKSFSERMASFRKFIADKSVNFGSSPALPTIETGAGLTLLHIENAYNLKSPYYGVGQVGAAPRHRYGWNSLRGRGAKITRGLKYGGATLTLIGLGTSYYQSYTGQQHWGWAIGDTLFTAGTYAGPWGWAAYIVYNGAKLYLQE